MCLANNILAQSNEMVCLDTYFFEDEVLFSKPKFDRIMEYDLIPISMWTEAICQNGELYCRSTDKSLKNIMLTNVDGVYEADLRKKDTRDIWFQTKKICQIRHYFKSEITVMKEKKILFVCYCTHNVQ